MLPSSKRSVSGEAPALLGEAGPAIVRARLRVPPNAPQHSWPRMVQHQITLRTLSEFVAVRDAAAAVIDDTHGTAWRRRDHQPRFCDDDSGQWGDHCRTGLPPGVDDRRKCSWRRRHLDTRATPQGDGFADPQISQGVGRPACACRQVGIGEAGSVADRLALPIDRHPVAMSAPDVAVDATVSNIHLAGHRTLRVR